jgi:hypothetical protein
VVRDGREVQRLALESHDVEPAKGERGKMSQSADWLVLARAESREGCGILTWGCRG